MKSHKFLQSLPIILPIVGFGISCFVLKNKTINLYELILCSVSIAMIVFLLIQIVKHFFLILE